MYESMERTLCLDDSDNMNDTYEDIVVVISSSNDVDLSFNILMDMVQKHKEELKP